MPISVLIVDGVAVKDGGHVTNIRRRLPLRCGERGVQTGWSRLLEDTEGHRRQCTGTRDDAGNVFCCYYYSTSLIQHAMCKQFFSTCIVWHDSCKAGELKTGVWKQTPLQVQHTNIA